MSSIHDPRNMRNVCIMAHVDHGKTSLADSLVASNQLLGHSQVGSARYMDSRRDEVERGITMKSSCVTLTYAREGENSGHIINLIDSPGHVDFSSEVSAAVRLCDGTIIVVDVLEGVCAQTKVVLRQSYREGIKPCLVLNKLDRLVLEKKMKPMDAYAHISHVLEQVNAYMGELYNMGIFRREEDESDLADNDDSNLYFIPERGNVIFACAFDNWGFRISDFVDEPVKKTGLSHEEVLKALWGDYYISTKNGVSTVRADARSKKKEPAFVQIVLRNIFSIYETIMNSEDSEKVRKIAENMGAEFPAYIAKSSNARMKLKHIMSQWKPLSTAVFETVLDHLPSPKDITHDRAAKLMCSVASQFQYLPRPTQALRPHFINCSRSKDAPIIVFISKMFFIDRSSIIVRGSQNDGDDDDPEESSLLVGFARVFSGTLRKGQKIYVLSPKHNPSDVLGRADTNGDLPMEEFEDSEDRTFPHIEVATIGSLYLQMGRTFQEINVAPAGYLVAIGGLGKSVVKTVTLSSTVFCPSFAELSHQSKPILRVSLTADNIRRLKELKPALEKLYKSDPCVEVERYKGDPVIVTAGEVHLERCIADLEKDTGLKITYFDPQVSFRETIVPKPTMDKLNQIMKNDNDEELDGKAVVETPLFTVEVEAIPLPKATVEFLCKHEQELQWLCISKRSTSRGTANLITRAEMACLSKLKKGLSQTLDCSENVDKIWSFGPNFCGSNILINHVKGYNRSSIWDMDPINYEEHNPHFVYDQQVLLAFDEACKNGPLCHEEMMGVGFIINRWEFKSDYRQHLASNEGAIVTSIKKAFVDAVKNSHQRLMIAMHTCTISATDAVIGKMYNLVHKRHGYIQHGDMVEGSTSWEVTTLLPVVESLKFGHELMKETSGEALPQLTFSHWELLDIDPFWEPETAEELEHYGEKSDSRNRAKQYMNDIRERKGLPIDSKIVEFAEKQRTLKRK